MKDYKRLTKEKYASYLGEDKIVCEAWYCQNTDCENCIAQKNYERLFELENKIESGELCDRTETAREILLLLGKGFDENTGKNFNNLPWYESFCRELKFRYGVELFGNSDKLEDKE